MGRTHIYFTLNDVEETFLFSLFIEPHKQAWLAFLVVKSAMKIWQLEKDIHKIRTLWYVLYCIRVSCIIVCRFYSGFFYVKEKISTQQNMIYECKKRIHTTTNIENVYSYHILLLDLLILSFIGNHEWMNCIFPFVIYTGIYDQHSFR